MIATQWLSRHHATQGLALGYFGASTGAGAALWAASYQGRAVSAIVSRGGRPELAAPRLSKVVAPTLLLVGENDEPVIEVNQEAMYHLGTSSLMIIPHASHLFEEPGALELVAEEAVIWFSRYFKQRIIAQSA